MTTAPEWLVLAAWVVLGLAVLPLVLTLDNLRHFRRPGAATAAAPVSVLIPARNEEANIGAAVRSVLSTPGDIEVVVLDDHSTDGTATVVRDIAAADPRVRLEPAPPLPDGWAGKQHACHVLAGLARHDVLVFMDADVRLSPGAVHDIAGALRHGGRDLVSGFPRERTESLGEHLTVPMVHVLLLGYLPMIGTTAFPRMTMFAVGCGQLIAARRRAYDAVGGHGAVRTSFHDGITLPRAFRRAGCPTGVFDASTLASCRMYGGWREAWAGFSKNATEGMATPVALPIWTLLLAGGHVFPWLMLAVGVAAGWPALAWIGGAAATASLAQRVILAVRLGQHPLGVILHPAAVLVMLAIQWVALARALTGRTPEWRGRRLSLPKAS